jgi:hypothetical protein
MTRDVTVDLQLLTMKGSSDGQSGALSGFSAATSTKRLLTHASARDAMVHAHKPRLIEPPVQAWHT